MQIDGKVSTVGHNYKIIRLIFIILEKALKNNDWIIYF